MHPWFFLCVGSIAKEYRIHIWAATIVGKRCQKQCESNESDLETLTKIIAVDWNLEPDFGNLPYPEKVPGTTRSDLGKIDKIYDIFTFCETVHRNQNLEPLPKMARREPKMTTLSQFFTRKVPVKLAK